MSTNSKLFSLLVQSQINSGDDPTHARHEASEFITELKNASQNHTISPKTQLLITKCLQQSLQI